MKKFGFDFAGVRRNPFLRNSALASRIISWRGLISKMKSGCVVFAIVIPQGVKNSCGVTAGFQRDSPKWSRAAKALPPECPTGHAKHPDDNSVVGFYRIVLNTPCKKSARPETGRLS